MTKFIRQLFCKHSNTRFINNIYGDAINRYATAKTVYRSIYKCRDCGKIILKRELNKHD